MKLTSRTNPIIVEAAALKEKKYRDEKRCFLAEGIKLFEEAVASGIEIEKVFVTEKNINICRNVPEDKVYEVTDEVLEKISTEKSPQGVICVLKAIDKIHIINKIYNKVDFSDGHTVMILSSVRDPGNIGTVIRSARALGCDELILSRDCADIYNPRTVRAAMGTLFRQRITYSEDLPKTIELMKQTGYKVYAAMLDSKAQRLDDMDIDRKTVFIVGNEGHGIDRNVAEAAGNSVYIPMVNGVESLNAATAASLFLWQSACKIGIHK